MNPSILNLAKSDEPIAVRGFQLPTIFMRLMRDYFQPEVTKWIPENQHLVFVRPQGPAVKSETLVSLEIGSFGEYRGDAHTDAPKLLFRREPLARVPNGWNHGIRQAPGFGGQTGTTYEKKWAGSIVIFAMAKMRGESELLAFEVSEFFSHFEEKIQDSCTLNAFRCNQVGSVGSLREYPNYFATPVVLDYAYLDNVKITEESLPIREITVSIK